MGAGNVLGLLLEISADPSKAQEALDRFNVSTGDSLKKAADGIEPLDKALLTDRESVRLLGEELGVHLPRQVSGAIAKMLPEIAGLGGALLGVFAAEKAFEWGKAINEQFFQIYTKGNETIKELDAAAGAAFKHAADEAADMLNHFKTSLAGAFDIAQIDAHAAELQRFHEAFKALADKTLPEVTEAMVKLGPTITAANAQGLYSLEEVDKKIGEIGQLQFEAHKHMAEVTAKETEHAAKDAERAADKEYQAAVKRYEANQRAYHASEEALKRLMALQEHLGRQALEAAHKEEEAREHAAVAVHRLTEELRKQGEQEARNAETLGKEVNRQIADITRIGDEQEKAALRGKDEARQRIEDQHQAALKAIQDHNAEAQAIARLKGDYKAMADAAIAAYTAMGQANANYLKQLAEQHKAEQKASQEGLNAEIAGIGALAEGAAELIGSKKGYYAVKAAEEVAAGIECLAEGTWPPNPLALIASGIHFESAAEYAKIAGTSARGSSAGGGGGGGYGGGGGGGGRQGGGQYAPYPGAGPQSPGSSPSYHLYFQSVEGISPRVAEQIGAALTLGVKTGTITSMVATEAFKTTPRS